MKIWITGGAGSGKSSLAQELASALAAGGPHYYVATMVPRDDEDRRRISRHIEDRAGMGFGTIECPCRLTERITPDSEGTYLLDSATAMLANAMFGEQEFVYDPDAAQKVAEDLQFFSGSVKHLIVVSDGIFSDAARYDEMTEGYRRRIPPWTGFHRETDGSALRHCDRVRCRRSHCAQRKTPRRIPIFKHRRFSNGTYYRRRLSGQKRVRDQLFWPERRGNIHLYRRR